jgi:hypothetical protein
MSAVSSTPQVSQNEIWNRLWNNDEVLTNVVKTDNLDVFRALVGSRSSSEIAERQLKAGERWAMLPLPPLPPASEYIEVVDYDALDHGALFIASSVPPDPTQDWSVSTLHKVDKMMPLLDFASSIKSVKIAGYLKSSQKNPQAD